MPFLLSPLIALVARLLPLSGIFPNMQTIWGNSFPVLSGVWGFIKKHYRTVLIALLSLGMIGTTYEWRHEGQALKTEKAAHAADVKSYKDAQAAAEKKAEAVRVQVEKTAKEQAHAADKNYSSIIAQYRANLLRYEATHRSPGRSGSGGSDGSTQEPNGPGGDPVLSASSITISDNDANICAINTARLQAAHDWAMDLLKGSQPNANATPVSAQGTPGGETE